MNFGYLLIISEHPDTNYLKLAYALALSIKNTQKPGYDKVALVTNNVNAVNELTSPWVFDHIIEWSEETFWDGRSWMDQLSPWDYTVCLDVDMLFFRDHSHCIEHFIETDTQLFLPSTVYTYRGEAVVSDYYRKTFTANDLPNLYSLYTFFKKDSAVCNEFFTLNRYIVKNPIEFKNTFLSNCVPKIVGTDEAFSLAAKILDLQNITYNADFLKVIHLKPMLQNWPWPADLVTDYVKLFFDLSGQMKIGNYQQTGIVHYVEKNTITDEVISILENIAWK